MEEHVAAAEREFGVEVGRTLLMAALESPKGILNAYEICSASDRMFGVAISGGDFRKCMQTKFQKDGIDMLVARGQLGQTMQERGHVLACHRIHAAVRARAVGLGPAGADARVREPQDVLRVRGGLGHIAEQRRVGEGGISRWWAPH